MKKLLKRGRKPRILEIVTLPQGFGEMAILRMKPLVDRYWRSRGHWSVDDVALSAYAQGVQDTARALEKQEAP